MLGLLKRLWGPSDSVAKSSANATRRRSATADVLANGPRAPSDKAKRTPAGSNEPEEAFDPYNTGKFDRSASWERISRGQR